MSVRVRLLAIVLISSVTLLTIGVGAAGYLVKSARDAEEWAELASSTTAPAILMVQAFQEERRLSLLYLAGDAEVRPGLAAARQRSDAALAAVIDKGDAARKLNPGGSASDIEGYNKLFAMVPTVRAGVDSQQAPPNDVFVVFSQVIGTIVAASWWPPGWRRKPISRSNSATASNLCALPRHCRWRTHWARWR
ncbi:nitrate- and nitrite sensing domain-containing protein [Nocardia asiatica]|uniref:nitrate- and nitrite sensing domain-containing protein n=1 Tax=Nocardia asiatica TaxID=209252 RepID=UPI003EE151A4